MEFLLKQIAHSYYKMNITDILNSIELSSEGEKALLYSTSATLILCCVYKGTFLAKKVCRCLAQKYADQKQQRIAPSPEPFEEVKVDSVV